MYCGNGTTNISVGLLAEEISDDKSIINCKTGPNLHPANGIRCGIVTFIPYEPINETINEKANILSILYMGCIAYILYKSMATGH
jgi:hypothetical protein